MAVATERFDPIARQRALSDASRRYARREISIDQYYAIRQQNSSNYGPALVELATRLTASEIRKEQG